MASLHDITVGQDIEFKRVLAKAGFTPDTIIAINRQPELANVMYQAIQSKSAPSTLQLFRTPAQVIEAFVARAKLRNWGFTEMDFIGLRINVGGLDARGFVSTLADAFSLDIWLGDLSTTFEELTLWIEDIHPFYRWDTVKSGKKQLRLLHPERYGNSPSVTPVAIDLNANRGKAPRDVRDANSTGFETMVAFAAHPEYPLAINYDTIPGVWLGGLQACVPGGDPWRSVPFLGWVRANHEVSLYALWGDYSRPDFSVPSVREL